jgi:acyl-CoA reductase-like NAD-dependent aldehyde dehydrogenase
MSVAEGQTRDVDWLARARAFQADIRNIVGNRTSGVENASALKKLCPRDGERLYSIASGPHAETDAAVEMARGAFSDGRWSDLTTDNRKNVLLDLAALIEAHRDEFALRECLDVGKPISDALHVDVPMATLAFRYNAEAVDKIEAGVFASEKGNLSFELKRPVGVVAAIIGWNFPLVLAASKVAPALAVGNSIVLKPSELTSLSAFRLAELALEAGVPEGVLNVVHGDGAVGSILAQHRDVDLLTFTGSTQTGKQLLVASGQSNMKTLLLECGGKAANIVFDDCPDLDAVAAGIVARAFWNQGEVCTASSRLLVHDAIADELLQRVVAKTAELKLADPLDPVTKFGPLVSRGHMNKVQSYISIGEKQGCKILYRSDCVPPNPSGFYVGPIIFDNVAPRSVLAQEEIFGPVLSVLRFGSEDEAVRLANNTIYGLSAIVWTRDLGRAHRMSRALDAGWVVVNATANPSGGPVLPIGGHKQSGIGVEGGMEGLQHYMTKTAVQYFV